jgi:hypothetical protein
MDKFMDIIPTNLLKSMLVSPSIQKQSVDPLDIQFMSDVGWEVGWDHLQVWVFHAAW